MALNLLGGVLADRMEPKFLVAAAQGTSATVVALLALSVLTGMAQPWHLLLAAVVIGAVQAVDQPSRASVSPRLVRPEHIVNAVAMDSLVWNVVRIAGPMLAGVVIQRVSIEASMFFSAATFYILAMVVSVLKMRPRPPSAGRALRQIGESLDYVRRHPVFFHVMLLTFCNSLFGMAYIGLMPVFAREVLHVGSEKIGWLLGASGAGAILGTWMVGNLKDGFPKGKMILGGAALYGLTLVLFALASARGWYEASMALLFAVGITNSWYLVGGLSTIQQLVPEGLRGRVMGLYGITWSLSPLSVSQAGIVAGHLGAPTAVAAGAAVIIAAAAVVYRVSPEVRGLRVGV